MQFLNSKQATDPIIPEVPAVPTQNTLERSHLKAAILNEVNNALLQRPGSSARQVGYTVESISDAMDDGTERVLHELRLVIDNGAIPIRLQNAITRYHPRFTELRERWKRDASATLLAAGIDSTQVQLMVSEVFSSAAADFTTYDEVINTLMERIPQAMQRNEDWNIVFTRYLGPILRGNRRVQERVHAFRTDPTRVEDDHDTI